MKIRLINENGDHIGVVDFAFAKEKANEKKLDLININPDVDPPIYKIMDYGKHKYQLEKKKKEEKKKQKNFAMKEVRLGKSVNIAQNDLNVKINQIKKFLETGHSVLVVQRFKKQENHAIGIERLNKISKDLENLCKIQKEPKDEKFNASMILAPKR